MMKLNGRMLLVIVSCAALLVLGLAIVGEQQHWSTAQHGVALQYTLAIVGILGGGIALWNVVESRQMRINSDKQVSLLAEQIRTAVAPAVVLRAEYMLWSDEPTYSPSQSFNEEIREAARTIPAYLPRLWRLIRGGVFMSLQIATAKQIFSVISRSQESMEQLPDFAVVSVANVSAFSIINLRAFVFSPHHQRFLVCLKTRDVITPGSSHWFKMNAPRITIDELMDDLSFYYGDEVRSWRSLLTDALDPYAALMFLSADSRLYLYRRHTIKVESQTEEARVEMHWL